MNTGIVPKGIAEEIRKALKQAENLPSYSDQVKNNADRWLRSLLEDNEKLRKERDAKLAFISKGNDEDMYWLQEENIRLSSELAAKDKVLEWYGGGSEDGGEKARSILKQYARSAIVPNE